MTHHDEEGAVGLVLSRPSELRIADAVPELGDLPYADEVVYIGGPVQPEAVVVLVEFDEPLEDAASRSSAASASCPRRDPDELGAAARPRLRGLLGLGPGQLEAELEEPPWIVVPAEPDDVFAADPDALWRTVLQRKGGMFSLIATMPYDPGLN